MQAQKTYMAKPGAVERKWYVVDAQGQRVGRLATQIATLLRGKHKPEFTPHVDVGDFVIVVNAEKVVFTGKKLQQKQYVRHSGYPGGLKVRTAAEMLQKFPIRVMEHAVKGMLPKGSLGADLYRKLHVYAGPNHPHQAQQPAVWPVRNG